MKRNYATLLFFSIVQVFGVWAQEVQIFKVEDFDLKGKVKSCLVITDYGREYFEFNEEGILTKTITQYNESDQDITDYKYRNGELLEKRMESYKNNVLDESTSMANFYTVDTVPTRKVVEKIVSYDKQFLEKEEYQYNEDGKLVRIISSNIDGVDETTLEYTPFKNELTVSTFTNGVLEKSVRTSERKGPKGIQKVILTKEYLDGEPNTAVEEVYSPEGKLMTQEEFLYDVGEKEFVSQKKLFYNYKEGVLQKVVTKTLNTEAVDEYIFQFDGHAPKNWTKKIITPDNTYTTRVIKYYPEEETQKEKTDKKR
ncbi:MAG: hypothetical protein VXW38_17235 [Bacteroidota bacterium]|nr:hypothetical protein [Bacteroidota bacterium]